MANVHYRYDVSETHRQTKKLAEIEMDKIKQARPKDYFMDAEYKRMQDTVRLADMRIDQYERMIKKGVKF